MEIFKQKNSTTYINFPLIDATNTPEYWSGMTWASAANTSIKGIYSDSNGAYASQAISNTPVEYQTTGTFTLQLTSGEMNHDKITIKLKADEIEEQTILIDTTMYALVSARSTFNADSDEVDIGSVKGAAVTGVNDFKASGFSTFDAANDEVDVGKVKGAGVSGVNDFKATGFAVAGDAMTLADAAITAAKFAANAITASALATDAVTEIVNAIFAKTGITAGGTATFTTLLKYIVSWEAGNYTMTDDGTNITWVVKDIDDASTIATVTVVKATGTRTVVFA